jgi:hypothetical protein
VSLLRAAGPPCVRARVSFVLCVRISRRRFDQSQQLITHAGRRGCCRRRPLSAAASPPPGTGAPALRQPTDRCRRAARNPLCPGKLYPTFPEDPLAWFWSRLLLQHTMPLAPPARARTRAAPAGARRAAGVAPSTHLPSPPRPFPPSPLCLLLCPAGRLGAGPSPSDRSGVNARAHARPALPPA